MDGMEVLAQLHRPDRSQRLPCLILSARDAVHNRIQGLRGGADDYLLKPFDLVELEARLSAILRRAAPHRYQQLVIANLRFEPEVRQAWVNDQALMLPRRESLLLLELMQASPRLLVKDYLLEQLYQNQTDISLNAIEALISKLRRKLREQNALVCIDTVRGVGYRLRAL
ncbi:two-component system response regulator [Alcaligenes faecalis]|nr:two-component system response regulator [Alcaligenes faecalis]